MAGMGDIRISNYVIKTEVLGPGKRFAIWFQGCKKRCHHCINPQGQELDGGEIISVATLLEIIRQQHDINGITISGGEPFLQYDVLKMLVKRVHEETNLDIMLYSGYTLQELVEMYGSGVMGFLSMTDIFIDGEYRYEEDTGSIYRGSDNQKIYFFTTRFKKYREQIYETKNRDIEFAVDQEEIYMVGVPPKDFYSEFIRRIGGSIV